MVTTNSAAAAHTFEHDSGLPFSWSRQILRRPSGNQSTTRRPRIATDRRDGYKRPLHTIFCRHCDTLLSDAVEEGCCREMWTNYFSASLVKDSVQVSGAQKYRTTLCCCDRMDVACRMCGSDIGYIVVQICDECNIAGHNGNRYVIYPTSVYPRTNDGNATEPLPVPER